MTTEDLSKYEKLDQRAHVYQRPDTYIGSVVLDTVETFLLNTKENDLKCVKKKILIANGLRQIFLEILANAGDNVERSRVAGVDPGKITVDVSGGIVSIMNGGLNMPTDIHPKYGEPLPQFILGSMLTGSNFNDEEERKLGGRNGIGAKATNIFSKLFVIEIGDCIRHVKYQQVFKENMSICMPPKITPDYNGIGYTKITYVADFARFYEGNDDLCNLKVYTEDMIQCFCKHAVDVAFTAGVEVIVNGKSIVINKLEDYGKLYVTNPLVKRLTYSDDDNDLIIFDTPGSGNCISFVNGIYTSKGGVHTNAWMEVFCEPVLEKFKKYELSIKDIKPHVTMMLSCKLDKPTFKTQSKEYLTAPKPDVGDLDLSEVGKWDLIAKIQSIISQKVGKVVSQNDGKKTGIVNVKKLKDADLAGSRRSEECILHITEGNSASTVAIKGIGNRRNLCGSYPVRGKMLNTSKCEDTQYMGNVEINDIKKLLGLKEGVDYSKEKEFKTLRYGKVRVISDQDDDGLHIRGLIFNFFRTKFPTLLKRGYVEIMETPLLIARSGSKKRRFYFDHEYQTWKQSKEATTGKWVVKYYKGLGTLTDMEVKEEFEDPKLTTYSYDDKAELYMKLAFDAKMEDNRKIWIKNHVEKKVHKTTPGTLSFFFDEQFVEFSIADLQRSIPSIYDGLKPSQRKIIYAAAKKNKETKVSQLAGYVADESKYHHGEESLQDTIINLAQSHIGTNNVPLLQHIGQFGSREGKDAASARYIFVDIASIFPSIFRKEDDILLETLFEEGESIEPRYYYPILPMFALNGCLGIGTGYSTSIPCYHPLAILQWLQVRIFKWMGKEVNYPELKPWYRGYQGVVRRIGKKWHSQGSFEEQSDHVIVRELPVTVTIKNYLEKLDKKREKGKITDYKDVSYSEPIKGKPDQFDKVPKIRVYGHKDPSIRSLGLDSIIGESNITLFDGDYNCRTFEGIEDVLEEYARLRRQKYKERIDMRLPIQQEKLRIEKLRMAYVSEVVTKTIPLQDEKLNEYMEEKGYPDSFLSMAIRSCTKKKIQELEKLVLTIENDIDYYIKITPEHLWLSELKDLDEKLRK